MDVDTKPFRLSLHLDRNESEWLANYLRDIKSSCESKLEKHVRECFYQVLSKALGKI